jgi:hypothetical protein
VFPWRRKESKKKTPTEYFTGIFVLKKSFKKRSHKEEKKERKNAKKVTKSDQMHSFPSRASLSLSLSPSTRMQQQQQQRESFGLVPPNPKFPNPQFHPTGFGILRVFKNHNFHPTRGHEKFILEIKRRQT